MTPENSVDSETTSFGTSTRRHQNCILFQSAGLPFWPSRLIRAPLSAVVENWAFQWFFCLNMAFKARTIVNLVRCNLFMEIIVWRMIENRIEALFRCITLKFAANQWSNVQNPGRLMIGSGIVLTVTNMYYPNLANIEGSYGIIIIHSRNPYENYKLPIQAVARLSGLKLGRR